VNHFSPAWKKTLDSTSRDSFIEVSVWFYSPVRPAESVLVISIGKAGKPVFWREVSLNGFYNPDRKWNQAILKCELPYPLPDGDKLQAVAWNRDTNEQVYLDDMQVNFYVRKEYYQR
jgi:hypothetical protein